MSAAELSWEVFHDLIAEAARVRDQVMPAYLAIGPAGENAVRNMRRQLDGVMQALLRREHERARVLSVALRAQHPPSEATLRAAKVLGTRASNPKPEGGQ